MKRIATAWILIVSLTGCDRFCAPCGDLQGLSQPYRADFAYGDVNLPLVSRALEVIQDDLRKNDLHLGKKVLAIHISSGDEVQVSFLQPEGSRVMGGQVHFIYSVKEDRIIRREAEQ